MRPGSLLMFLGAIVLVASGVFAFGVFAFGDESGADGELPLLSWGAMAAGAALIVTGWLRRPAAASAAPEAAPPLDTVRIDAMVRCMGFIAAADGHVDKAERSIFADIVERVTGRALGAEERRRLLDLAADQIFDPATFVRQHAGVLDDGFRRLIVKAGCFIALADGALSDGEADRLRSLAAALGIPNAEYEAIVVGLRTDVTA